MSVFETPRPAPFSPAPFSPVPLGAVSTLRVVSLFERGIDALVEWRNARVTASVLRNLSDQQLDDIGLHRGEIARVSASLSASLMAR